MAPFVTLWEAEKARLDAEANRPRRWMRRRPRSSPIKAAFAAAEADGFVVSSLGFRADATRRSIGDIEGLIDLVSSGALTAPVTFRDYDNAYHSLTLDQLNILRLEAGGRGPPSTPGMGTEAAVTPLKPSRLCRRLMRGLAGRESRHDLWKANG